MVVLVVLGFILLELVSLSVLGMVKSWMLMLSLLAGVLFLTRPKIALVSYWLWVTLTPYAINMYLPASQIRLIDELLLLVLIGILAVNLLMTRKPVRVSPRLKAWLLLFLVICGASTVANKAPLYGAFRFTLIYMRPFVLFLYAAFFLEPKDIKPALKICLAIFVLQVVLNFGWLTGVSHLPHYKRRMDIATGTFESCAVTAYFCMAIMFICLACLASSRRGKSRKAWLALLFAIALAQMFFTFTMHAIVAFPLCAVLFLAMGRKYLKVVMLGIILSLLLLPVLATRRSTMVPFVMETVGPRSLTRRWYRFRNSPKTMAYRNVMFGIPDELPFPLFGSGPGTMGSVYAIEAFRPLSEKYFSYAFVSSDMRTRTAAASILGSPFSGYLAIWSETGPIGFLIYWGLHVYMGLRILLIVRSRPDADPFVIALAEAFVPMMAFVVVVNAADDLSKYKLISGIWVWASLLWIALVRDGCPGPRVAEAATKTNKEV